MVSTFLKSFSLRTPLSDMFVANMKIATPRTNGCVHLGRVPATNRLSRAQAGFAVPPATPTINFQTAVTSIGSASNFVDEA